MQRNLTALILTTIVIAGCGGDDPFDPDRPRRGPATQLGGQLAPVDEQGQPVGGQPAPPPPPSSGQQSQNGGALPPPPPPPGVNTVQEEAQPGVTGKGQDYGGGLITTPVAAYFSTGERIVFNIQIPHTLRNYTALHGPPKTHEEFMEKVIKGIALPDLPDGHRYVFDPERQQLMVEHPR